MPPAQSAREVAARLGLADASHHVLICTLCEGGEDAVVALRRQVKQARMTREVHVSEAHCLGVCEDGPTCIVYPDGTWYHGMDADLVGRLVDEHLIGGSELADRRTIHGPGTRSASAEA
jgi:(2Fe-2S) ferredoxin